MIYSANTVTSERLTLLLVACVVRTSWNGCLKSPGCCVMVLPGLFLWRPDNFRKFSGHCVIDLWRFCLAPGLFRGCPQWWF
jgi:hypothetical protein